MSETGSFLATPAWLRERMDAPGLSIVDASWYLPAQQRDARAEYAAAHIPGAVFFDHDAIVDEQSELPHTLPSAAAFSRHASRMGISKDDCIVVYDGPGIFTAPRAWWMFRLMGAQDVRVLQGGFDRWKEAGLPVTDEDSRPEPAKFVAALQPARVADLEDMRALVGEAKHQIVDARPHARFTGDAAEPRQGVRAGHMPGAVNLPFTALSENGALHSPARLKEIFKKAGIDPHQPIVTTCGSGVTAAVINFALETMDERNHRLYDGSWTEWGGDETTPIETGP